MFFWQFNTTHASGKHSIIRGCHARVPEVANGRLCRGVYRLVRGPKWYFETSAHDVRFSAGVCSWTTPVEYGIRLGPSRSSPFRAGGNLLRRRHASHTPGVKLSGVGTHGYLRSFFGSWAHWDAGFLFHAPHRSPPRRQNHSQFGPQTSTVGRRKVL